MSTLCRYSFTRRDFSFPSLFISLSVLLFSILLPHPSVRQWQVAELPSSILFSLSFPVSRQTECQGTPHEFPAWGSDPIFLGRLKQCEFFKRLNLSGGKEFTFSYEDVGKGRPRTQTYTQTTCSPKPAGRLGYMVGITCFSTDSVTCLWLQSPISRWYTTWLCLQFCRFRIV